MSASGVSFIAFGSFSSYSQIRPVKVRITASAAGAALAERKRSLYEVLRVKETATVQEIKAAYRALAKRYHPDVSRVGDGNGSEFMEIRGAYETLSDPAAKARYDRTIGRVGFYHRAGLWVPRGRWETDQCW